MRQKLVVSRKLLEAFTRRSDTERFEHFNPFTANCSKLLLFKGFSAILV